MADTAPTVPSVSTSLLRRFNATSSNFVTAMLAIKRSKQQWRVAAARPSVYAIAARPQLQPSQAWHPGGCATAAEWGRDYIDGDGEARNLLPQALKRPYAASSQEIRQLTSSIPRLRRVASVPWSSGVALTAHAARCKGGQKGFQNAVAARLLVAVLCLHNLFRHLTHVGQGPQISSLQNCGRQISSTVRCDGYGKAAHTIGACLPALAAAETMSRFHMETAVLFPHGNGRFLLENGNGCLRFPFPSTLPQECGSCTGRPSPG
eukprot:364713-Chlamydomonas_euryale.AAC.3